MSDSNDSMRDSDVESEDEEDFATTLPTDVHEFALKSTTQLSQLVKTFPHIPHEQRKVWAALVSPIVNSTIPSSKFALIGKTGSGKSTLINCLLEDHVLPTSAAFSRRACTSAITEISYKNINGIEGTIIFLTKEEWREECKTLLNAIHHDHETNSPDSFGNRCKAKLYMLFPSLRNKDLGPVTVSQLLKIEPAKSRLGTSYAIPPSDANNFRAQLEQFLSSSNSDNPVLWPLVRRVEIRGRFSVLSSGIVLVDLPGHNDDNDTRNNFVHDYMKVADGYILVADAKRAQDDRVCPRPTSKLSNENSFKDTRGYLRKILDRLLLDGRSVEDSIIVAATGTDTGIVDNEIAIPEHERPKLNALSEELHGLRQSLRPPKKSKSTKSKTNWSQDQREIGDRIREREKEKNLILANIRIARVRRSLQSFFKEIPAGFSEDGNRAPVLPVFCLGSQDFLALISGHRSPSIFYKEDETELPALATHLRKIGERHRINWADTLLNRAIAFSEEVHQYFSEGRHPGRLPAAHKKRATDLIADLEKVGVIESFTGDRSASLQRNLQEAEDAFDGIQDELQKIEYHVQEAVIKATASAPQVVREFGSGKMYWKTYKSCMSSNGVHPPYDLNRELTKSILPDIQSSWNASINHRIPLVLKDAIMAIEQNTLVVVDEVVELLSGSTSERPIGAARRHLPIESILGDLLQENIESILVAQRDGTRSFKNTVQKQMIEQYQVVAKEYGNGCYARMKASNQQFIEENADNVFGLINTNIQHLLHPAFAKIKKDTRGELTNITVLLRVCLVDEINLSGDHKEIKDAVLKMVVDNRPLFTSKKCDIDERRRALGC
ncbi:hypothetical protein B0H16DRAFT_1705073 [Mycena metata]|uniref:Dynamin N-terminal domain-containing protein n=1 Tax=Mycena metata TaxID=1033252 RepID=A0AAD7GR10_9AGAR|nr:hypothetical protein B0H16DRAFT_1705073 [Mycena metata]